MGIPQLDELKNAHNLLTGGRKGAPQKNPNGDRVGNSILKSSVVMISAVLQAEVEDTFKYSVKEVFKHLSDEQIHKYIKNNDRWGNPNPGNIENLFFRIGIPDAINGLSWQNCDNKEVRKVLDNINQIRNDIAHGGKLYINGKNFNLTLPIVKRWISFSEIFCEKFKKHIVRSINNDRK